MNGKENWNLVTMSGAKDFGDCSSFIELRMISPILRCSADDERWVFSLVPLIVVELHFAGDIPP